MPQRVTGREKADLCMVIYRSTSGTGEVVLTHGCLNLMAIRRPSPFWEPFLTTDVVL
jgi:hypothetical protein